MKDDFKTRLIDEYNEVYVRRQKLNKFLNEFNEGKKDSENSMSLLIVQLYAMDTYIQILRLRFLELKISWEDYHKTKEGE